MSLGAADRVKDTTISVGTTDVTLDGTPPDRFRTFNAGVGVGPSFSYTIEARAGGEFETGRGHLSSATTLVRDEVKTSSNGNALVSFGAGIKDVYITVLADDVNRVLLAQTLKITSMRG